MGSSCAFMFNAGSMISKEVILLPPAMNRPKTMKSGSSVYNPPLQSNIYFNVVSVRKVDETEFRVVENPRDVECYRRKGIECSSL